MFCLGYFAFNKHIINTVTCFFQSYIQPAFLVMVFFILLVQLTGMWQIYERDSGNW